MSRWTSSTNEAAAAQLAVSLRVLVKLDFPSGAQYYHDGVGNLDHAGHTYLGVGQFGGISGGDEDLEVIAKGLSLTLTGVPLQDDGGDPILESALLEEYQGHDITVYVGLLNASTGAWHDTPEERWAGKMDVMTITIGEGTADLKLQCEHRLRKEPRIKRYTDQDQRKAHPTDKFFNLLHHIAGFRGAWGAQGYGYGMIGSNDSPVSPWFGFGYGIGP